MRIAAANRSKRRQILIKLSTMSIMIEQRFAIALAVLGLACAAGWAYDYSVPAHVIRQRQVELSADEVKACQKMMKDFDAFDGQLERNQIRRESPEDDLRAIEGLLKAGKIEDSPAVRLLLALRETPDSCAMHSYTVLAKVWLTNSLDFGMRSNRIATYVHYYVKLHALNCRPEYERQFGTLMEEMKSNVDPKALERVQTSLAGMKFKHLTEDSKLVKFPNMLWRIISDPLGIIDHIDHIRFGKGASKTVAKQIATMMKEDGVWDSFRPFKPVCSKAAVPAICWPGAWSSTAPAKAALREYLFGPCDHYSRHFKPVLAPARLDANIQEEGQPDPLLSYSVELTNAMANRLMCLHLAEISKDEMKLLAAALLELKRQDSKHSPQRELFI